MLPSSLYTHQFNYKPENNDLQNTSCINLVSKSKPSHSDINLIDFLGNDDLNPQKTHENVKDKQIADYQLKMLEEFCRTSTLTRQHNELEEAEFRSFFDKYEHNNKPNSSKTQATLNYEDIRAFEQTESNQRFADNPCVVNSRRCIDIHNVDETPKMLKPEKHKELELENGEMKLNEDLIDEILFEQHLEKQRLVRDASANSNKNKTAFVESPHKLSTSIDSKMPKVDYNNIFDEILTNNEVKYSKTPPANKNSHLNTAMLRNPSAMISEHIKDYTINIKTKLDQKALTEELVSKYDVKYLEAIKKIEKVFQKRSILKSDAEKAKLTPGPNLYEKTVILPQMMQRLNARNKDMENKSMEMKLILDVGPSSTKSSVSSQSGIQNSLSTTSMKQPRSRNQQEENVIKHSLILNDEPSIASLITAIPVNQNNKSAQKKPIPNVQSIKSAVETRNANSKSIKTTINTPVSIGQSNKHVIKTPAFEDILDGITVLTPPEVLMSDCAKQRYVASETGKLFNNFVRAGTYYAP